MKARILAYLDDLRSSYWFIPTLMVVGAVGLSIVTTVIDGRIGDAWVEQVPWLYGNKPEGARNLLTTVAGSMIGVAGVTFSVTIASVVYASGQYGPRLLTNFMSDRGNQITLGTFIATFLYCLLVLRTVRTAGEASGAGNPVAEIEGAFVPHIAVATAIGLTLASVGVLIFFIHHVPKSIHVSNVIAGVGQDLRRKIHTLFPERIGTAAPPEAAHEDDDIRTQMPEDFYQTAESVECDGAGYLQGIDTDTLLRLANEHGLLLRLRIRPGDFVSQGDTLALAWPADRITDDVRSRLRLAYAWGNQRTALQDTRFLLNELVEIAARALSPGINDPFTANSCMDWLVAALKDLAGRDFPEPTRFSESGDLRIVTRAETFEGFVHHVFGQLRPYVASDRNAALHAFHSLAELAGRASGEDHMSVLRHEAKALFDGAQTALPLEADRQDVAHTYALVQRLLTGHADYQEIVSESDWIGGTA